MTMAADDLINCLMMHCSSPEDDVIIVIDKIEYRLTGTIIGDEEESAVYVYAE